VGKSLISVGELVSQLSAGAPRPALLDVRWELASGSRRQDYLDAHLPDAAFVDLDAELSGPPGSAGRHPLPDSDAFQASMRDAGVDDRRPVVVYDDARSLAAARAWWLLRYFGHSEVAVLDGGIAAWESAGEPTQAGAAAFKPGDFTARAGWMTLIDAGGAAALARRGVLLDARAPERYRGEHEPIDPVAGHIPGARNAPMSEHLDASGHFLAPGELRAALQKRGVRDGVELGAYCGSGITAAHEVLALELAGYRAALYVGSWSEWIADPSRPVATSEDERGETAAVAAAEDERG
jgi:thiosulfate/3-mercaptopyruvate sulfurtransferase